MHPSRNFVKNDVNSKAHTTVVAAVSSAVPVKTGKGKGQFILFEPTKATFEKLPACTVYLLLKPENKTLFTAVLTYPVVPAKLHAKKLLTWIKKAVRHSRD